MLISPVVVAVIVVNLLEHGRQLSLAQTCDGDGPCRCVMSDGSGVVDISSIGNRDGTPKFPDAYSYDGNSYAYNPCFSMSVGGCKNAAVCKKGTGDFYTDLGSQASAVWSFTGFYPMATYTSSSGAKTEVMFICDPGYVNPQLDVIGEYDGSLSMNLWSNCACPGTCKRVDPAGSAAGGLSAGSIMLIVFFGAIFVYLAAGMTFNYIRTQTVGKETLPNCNFWSVIPGLVLDGFKFSWDHVCRRNSEYSQI